MARVYCVLNQVLRGKDALERPPATLKRDGPGVIARDPHSLGDTPAQLFATFFSVDQQYRLHPYEAGSQALLEMGSG